MDRDHFTWILKGIYCEICAPQALRLQGCRCALHAVPITFTVTTTSTTATYPIDAGRPVAAPARECTRTARAEIDFLEWMYQR